MRMSSTPSTKSTVQKREPDQPATAYNSNHSEVQSVERAVDASTPTQALCRFDQASELAKTGKGYNGTAEQLGIDDPGDLDRDSEDLSLHIVPVVGACLSSAVSEGGYTTPLVLELVQGLPHRETDPLDDSTSSFPRVIAAGPAVGEHPPRQRDRPGP